MVWCSDFLLRAFCESLVSLTGQSQTTARPEFAYYSKHGADFNQSWDESTKTRRFIAWMLVFQGRESTAAQQFGRSSGGAAKVSCNLLLCAAHPTFSVSPQCLSVALEPLIDEFGESPTARPRPRLTTITTVPERIEVLPP